MISIVILTLASIGIVISLIVYVMYYQKNRKLNEQLKRSNISRVVSSVMCIGRPYSLRISEITILTKMSKNLLLQFVSVIQIFIGPNRNVVRHSSFSVDQAISEILVLDPSCCHLKWSLQNFKYCICNLFCPKIYHSQVIGLDSNVVCHSPSRYSQVCAGISAF